MTKDEPDDGLSEIAASLAARYFTLWTGSIPLIVFRAYNLREARKMAASEELLHILRRATVAGRPLLSGGAKVWVGIASDDERASFDRAAVVPNPFGATPRMIWLQDVDGQ